MDWIIDSNCLGNFMIFIEFIENHLLELVLDFEEK